MASDVGICNRALQKLGARRITSLGQDHVNARACNIAFEPVRDALLREHPWNFAIKLASLAVAGTDPIFGRNRSFQLPTDYLRLLSKFPEDNDNTHDWQIQGKKIHTDDSAPLEVRYIAQITDPNEMDALFREALATDLALEMCEELTQSNTKKAALVVQRKVVIGRAKKTNAIENVAAVPFKDEWESVRS